MSRSVAHIETAFALMCEHHKLPWNSLGEFMEAAAKTAVVEAKSDTRDMNTTLAEAATEALKAVDNMTSPTLSMRMARESKHFRNIRRIVIKDKDAFLKSCATGLMHGEEFYRDIMFAQDSGLVIYGVVSKFAPRGPEIVKIIVGENVYVRDMYHMKKRHLRDLAEDTGHLVFNVREVEKFVKVMG